MLDFGHWRSASQREFIDHPWPLHVADQEEQALPYEFPGFKSTTDVALSINI